MGLIKAAKDAIGSMLADQWREYFYCDSLSNDILVVKGQKRVNSGRNSNKGSDNIITDGSIIAVNEGQCMIIVDQGQIVEFSADAGEFIYDGVQTLNEMSCIEESASLFSFLYHVSVGIERLQKIIVVLCENITVDDYEEFEKSLITHSHSELSERIAKHMTSKFNAKENDFLQVLTVFYKKARYNRFAVNTSGCEEEKVLSSYVEKYLEKDKLLYNFITNKIVVEENVRELIGRVVGNISKKYYDFLKEKARENNTYSYELRTYSKAEKIFLSNNRKNSLQDLKVTEKGEPLFVRLDKEEEIEYIKEGMKNG